MTEAAPRKRKPATKVVAYVVTETTESSGGVVFAKTNAQARREGACRYSDGDWDSVECRRAPEFDRFAKAGGVSDLEMWRRGWWFECSGCGRRIDNDFGIDFAHRDLFDDGDLQAGCDVCEEGEDAEPIEHQGWLYCDEVCLLDAKGLLHVTRTRAAEAVVLAYRHLPEGCIVTRGYGNSDYVPVPDDKLPKWRWPTRRRELWQASFTFPGAKHGGQFQLADDPKAKPEVTMTRGDLPAWEMFRGRAPVEITA